MTAAVHPLAPAPAEIAPECWACHVAMTWRNGEWLCPVCRMRPTIVTVTVPRDLSPRVREDAEPPAQKSWLRGSKRDNDERRERLLAAGRLVRDERGAIRPVVVVGEAPPRPALTPVVAPAPAGRFCRVCGSALPPKETATGRPRLYCSTRCNRRARLCRRRDRSPSPASVYQAVPRKVTTIALPLDLDAFVAAESARQGVSRNAWLLGLVRQAMTAGAH